MPHYNEILAQKREERKRAIEQIKSSLADIPIEQERLRTQMRKTEKESVRDMFLTDIEKMEDEKEQLEIALIQLSQESQTDLGNLDEELRFLEERWTEYPLEKRIALINFLIQEISLDMASPRWIRIRITWSRDDWGCEQMYLLREEKKAPRWTEEEVTYIKEHLMTASKDELMEHLDTRTWQAIRNRGYVLGIVRNRHDFSKKYTPADCHFSVRDFQFIWEMGLSMNSTNTSWESVTILK